MVGRLRGRPAGVLEESAGYPETTIATEPLRRAVKTRSSILGALRGLWRVREKDGLCTVHTRSMHAREFVDSPSTSPLLSITPEFCTSCKRSGSQLSAGKRGLVHTSTASYKEEEVSKNSSPKEAVENVQTTSSQVRRSAVRARWDQVPLEAGGRLP